MTTTEIIFAIIISAITGTIASLVAPWSKWGVEKKKMKLRWRKELISRCKEIINKNRFNPDIFKETSFYASIKPYLSQKLQKEVEEKRYEPGKVMPREQKIELAEKEFDLKKKLFDEISFLERKWGLI
ncbi:MAG: hypothetical protein AABW63_01510 [Nanoarchaeota archaeon]